MERVCCLLGFQLGEGETGRVGLHRYAVVSQHAGIAVWLCLLKKNGLVTSVSKPLMPIALAWQPSCSVRYAEVALSSQLSRLSHT